MKSLWNQSDAALCKDDPLQLRVYTSRLLGQESSLVLHGGGNTSVKADVTDCFGDQVSVLYIKGSGWDLASIEAAGFAPTRLEALQRLAERDQLNDTDMVHACRAAMIDPMAPTPSVEAILHAMIPHTFVDHTHADAVVTLSNTPDGEACIRRVYGSRIVVIPYVMPGFVLAKQVRELTKNVDWQQIEGMVLMNHGMFTFADTAKESYERMIRLVSEAEAYISAHSHPSAKPTPDVASDENLSMLATLRQSVSKQAGVPMLAQLNSDAEAVGFSRLSKVAEIGTRGPLTPDHVIRTKRIPVMVTQDVEADVCAYAEQYRSSFDRLATPDLKCLDPAPRWAIWPGYGTVSFGSSTKDAQIITDIVQHTQSAIQNAEALGGWRALPEKDVFEVEYWELEQAKLAKNNNSLPLQGKIALVTGAANGIGRACAEQLQKQGASLVALDIDPKVTEYFNSQNSVGLVCDVCKRADLQQAVKSAVRHFGGLDILISNAGIFPAGEHIEDISPEVWEKSLSVNLSSHQALLAAAIPWLKLGIEPAVVIIASKNVPAPGPGAAAYSAAKAGLTQLARVAALELAASRIRVNVLHPNAVFDTGIWTPEVLENRAKHYGMSVEAYKRRNLMQVEITSNDVARLACVMVGSLFAKTTGAQIPIDGGDVRVI